MARTTHVKSAQARFKTVPTIDPATGEQKVTPVLRKDGTQKHTKGGKPVVIRLTHADKTQPLPNRKCDKCGTEITPGTAYKWIKPKSGPYGGRLMVRCGTCPGWNVWEYSSSLSSRLAEISHNAHTAFDAGVESPEDVTSILEAAAEEVRSLAQEKRDSAENIREGFQHDTYQSEELDQQADDLDSWADEIEQAEVPELPEPDDEDCPQCDGSGKIENDAWDPEDEESDEDEEVDCPECDGSGTLTNEDPTDEQMDEWRNDAEAALEIVDESPV